MTEKRKIGVAGEDFAAEVLKSQGYYILRRNFSCPYGEVDIVAINKGVISFVEVKTRTTTTYGEPSEAVDFRKQRHIRNAARYFLSRYKREYAAVDFQVMEVTANHIKNLEL